MSTVRKAYSTPPGELSWMFFNGPGTDNYNKDGKVYKGTVTLSGKAKDDLIADVKAFREETKTKGFKLASIGYHHPHTTDDEGNKIPTLDEDKEPVLNSEGEPVYKVDKDFICVTFSTGVSWPDGKAKKIKIYNAKGNEVSIGDKKIGNGSKGCLVGSMSTFQRATEEGITFYLDGIQLIKFKEYEGGDADLQTYEEEDAFEGFEETSGVEMEAEVPKEEKKKATKARPSL